MSGDRRRPDAVDQAVDRLERIRRLEIMPVARVMGPKSWAPERDEFDVIAQHLATLGAFIPTDVMIGRRAQQIRDKLWTEGYGGGLGGTQLAVEFTRLLQVIGGLPTQRKLMGTLQHTAEAPGARIGGFYTAPGLTYGDYSNSPDAKWGAVSPPYPPAGGRWDWRAAGSNLSQGMPGAGPYVPNGAPMLKVYDSPGEPYAVEPGGYLYLDAGGQSAIRVTIDGAFWIVGSPPDEILFQCGWAGDVAPDPGPVPGVPIMWGTNTPICAGNVDGDIEAGQAVVQTYFLPGDSFYFATPPVPWVGQPYDWWYRDAGAYNVATWPGWVEWRTRVADAFATYGFEYVLWWYSKALIEAEADRPESWRWQTLPLQVPYSGRVEFRVHERACYLRGRLFNPFAWDQKIAQLPAWLVPEGRSRLTAGYGDAVAFLQIEPAGELRVDTTRFAQAEADPHELVLDGASFLVKPHDPMVP